MAGEPARIRGPASCGPGGEGRREAGRPADSLKLARDSTVAAQLLQHLDRNQNAETPQNGTRPLLYRFWRSISPNRGTPI